jgi:hypothetical protein
MALSALFSHIGTNTHVGDVAVSAKVLLLHLLRNIQSHNGRRNPPNRFDKLRCEYTSNHFVVHHEHISPQIPMAVRMSRWWIRYLFHNFDYCVELLHKFLLLRRFELSSIVNLGELCEDGPVLPGLQPYVPALAPWLSLLTHTSSER